jgi:hypothetical protein
MARNLSRPGTPRQAGSGVALVVAGGWVAWFTRRMPDVATGARSGRTPKVLRVSRWVLFGLLIASAGWTLIGLPELQREVASGHWPRAALAGPPALLALFIIGFAAYRIALVRAGRAGAGKALVQVAVMILVFAVVAGVALRPAERVAGEGTAALARPLASTDPDVRALAAEVARYRPQDEVRAVAGRLVELLDDPAPEVRRQAHAALVALAGSDVGGEGAGAAARWRSWARGAGLVR